MEFGQTGLPKSCDVVEFVSNFQISANTAGIRPVELIPAKIGRNLADVARFWRRNPANAAEF
jgi:hypothetical protein